MSEIVSSLLSKTGFETLFKHAPVGILAVGETGLIELSNPYAERLFGYGPGDLNGRNHDILLTLDLREKHKAHVHNYFQHPVDRAMGIGMKLAARRKDGSVFPAEIGLAFYEFEGRKMAVAFVADITEHERTKEQLRVNEQNIRLLIEHTPAAIAMFDRQMRYIAVSKRWLKDYQLNGKNIIGLSHYDVFPEVPKRWRKLHARCLAGEASSCDEDPFPRADGSTDWVQWELCPWYAADGSVGGAILFSEVITDKKLSEDRLRHHAIDLEQEVKQRTQQLQLAVEQLETAKEGLSESLEKEKELGQLKTRFVSMASHEFRTPLTTILLSSTLIDKYSNLRDNPNITKHTEKIRKSVFGLTGILDDFLSLEKLESGNVEVNASDFDIVKLAEDLTEEMQQSAKLDQHILYSHTGSESMVHLDSRLLRNCVINLISNAIKYSGEQTVIEFETEVSAPSYKVTVKDNGIGIPQSEQKHLFDAFFRAHNTGDIQGTGLGLNIVARYVKLMNGKIEFYSKLNEGTRFVLTFPKPT